MINHFHVVSLFLLFNLTCPELWSEPGDEDEDAELMFSSDTENVVSEYYWLIF